jgi:hypothetical protein
MNIKKFITNLQNSFRKIKYKMTAIWIVYNKFIQIFTRVKIIKLKIIKKKSRRNRYLFRNLMIK